MLGWSIGVGIAALLVACGGFATVTKERAGGLACSGISLLVVALAVLGFVYARATLRERWMHARERAADIRPSRTCYPWPVVYHGWYGSVHEFEMSNDRFTHGFVKLNRGKVLRT